MTDYGTSVSPYLATGYGSDSYSSNDTGTSTLTTDGHLLATDTFTYGEGSSNVAYDSITFANGATVSDDVASASDNYSNTDSGAITRSDSTTTSYDHFTLGDTHWTSGSFATVINDANHSESFNDASTDCDIIERQWREEHRGRLLQLHQQRDQLRRVLPQRRRLRPVERDLQRVGGLDSLDGRKHRAERLPVHALQRLP